MSLAALLQDLLALVVQGTLVAAAAAALARALPLERPSLELTWWRTVLLATLVLPFLGIGAPSSEDRIQVRTGSAVSFSASPALALGRTYWPEMVATALALGLVVRALRLVRGAARLRTLRRRASLYDASPLRDIEATVGARADIRVSPDVAVPATFGLGRPVILLPAHVLTMTAEHQRAIVAHELLHVRRRDWPRAVAEEILAVLFWFHPGLHFLLRRIRLAREQCVDAAVVAALGEREAYLESLLEVARRQLHPRPVPAALFLGEHHLAQRVDLLLKEISMSKTRTLSHLLVGAVFLAAAGLAASASFPLMALAAPSEGKAPVARQKASPGEPRLVHKVNPEYPAEAKKNHVEGVVHVDAHLAKDGSVAEATVKDGTPILAEAALVAVRQWRYEPVLGADNKPVEVTLTVTVNFRLAD